MVVIRPKLGICWSYVEIYMYMTNILIVVMFVTHLPTLTHLSHTYVSVTLSHISTFSRTFFQVVLRHAALPVGLVA